jgi:membrane protein
MLSKIRDRLDENNKRLLARLQKVWAFRLVGRLFLEFRQHEAAIRAAAIAYYVLLSLFPLLLGLVSLLGFFLPYASVMQAVSDTLKQVLPGSAELVQKTLDNVIRMRGGAGIVSVLLLLWSGSSLYGAVGRAINRAWNIKRSRNLFLVKLHDLSMVFGTGLLFLFSMASSATARFFDQVDGPVAFWVVAVGGRLASFLLTFGLFTIIYRYVPNIRTFWRWTWPGALLTTVFFQAGTYIFLLYVTNFTDYQSVYGSLSSVIVLLLWMYLSAMFVILGAELNSELQRQGLGMKSGGIPDNRLIPGSDPP